MHFRRHGFRRAPFKEIRGVSMKKQFFVLCTLLLVAPVWAQFSGPGATPPANSVSAVLQHPVDDMHVVLRGHIIQQLTPEKYMFSDGKAQIRVEIDQHDFPKQTITPTTVVEIVGEVEKEFLLTPEIDVDYVRVIQ
jgi:uncharacterized protein (TIGR00156 family)